MTGKQEESCLDPATQALLKSGGSGDVAALAALFDRVGPALYGWVHLRMKPHMRARVEAEDIVQEVWLRFLKHLPELANGQKNARGWLFRSARYVLIETSRALDGARTSTAHPSSIDRAFAATQSSILRRLSTEDAVQAFLRKVENLHARDRELVVLRGLEGLGFAEIASRVGGNEEMLEKRWQRLRARFTHDPIPEYLLI